VALYAAGAYSFETGLKLIRSRAEIMSRAPQGSMATLVGFDSEKLQQAIVKTPNVWLANDDLNYAVISGTPAGISSILSNVHVERAIPLNVSAAFHTPLMETAALEFEQVLESTPFQSFDIPVFSSTDFLLSRNIAQLKNSLIKQICQPVRWQMISRTLVTQGIGEAIQIGGGQGLIKPMKQFSPDLEVSNIASIADINSLVIRDQLRKLSSLKPELLEA
jgi:[acyl-carrier-protein] S-malonyltransferase